MMIMKDFRKALSNQSQLSFYNRQGGIVTYTIEREIGRGSSCIVYDASYETNAGDRKLVRLKECYPYKLDIHRLDDGSLQASKECQDEFKVYQEKMMEDFLLSNRLFETEGLNDSITNFIDIYEGNQTRYVISTYLKTNTLANYQPKSLKSCIHIVLQVAKAIQKIHEAGYLYLDTKPDNILIVEGEYERIHLFDFDSLIPLSHLEYSEPLRISYSHGYAPIELKLGDHHHLGYYSDVYSVGALLFYLMFQRTPTALDCEEHHTYPYEQIHDELIYPQKLYDEFLQFFQHTLVDYYLDRYPTMQQVIQQLEQIYLYADETHEYLLSTPMMMPSLCLGREQELKQLQEWIHQEEPFYYIYGMGGIGKSTFIKTFCQKHKQDFDQILYLYFEHSLKQMIIRDDYIHLSTIQRESQESSDDYYERKKLKLKQYLQKHKVLIVIDQYEFQASNEWSEFIQLGWKVIMISREQPPILFHHQMEIKPLQKLEDCQKIFACAFGRELKEEESKWIQQLQGHPLLIELCGKQYANHPEVFHPMMNHHVLLQQKDKIWFHKDQHLYHDDMQQILKTLFDEQQLQESQRIILKLIWLYGRNEIPLSYFMQLYEKITLSDLYELHRLGWIHYDQGYISMHPLIQEVVQQYEWSQEGIHQYERFIQQMKKQLDKIPLVYLPYLEGFPNKLTPKMKQQSYIELLEQYSKVEKKELSIWMIDEIYQLRSYAKHHPSLSLYILYQYYIEYYLEQHDNVKSKEFIEQVKPRTFVKADPISKAHYHFLWVAYYDARNDIYDPFLYLKHLDQCMFYLKYSKHSQKDAFMMSCYSTKINMYVRSGLGSVSQVKKLIHQYHTLLKKGNCNIEDRFGYYISLAWYYCEVEQNQKNMEICIQKAYAYAIKCFPSQLDIVDMIYIPTAQMMLDLQQYTSAILWLKKGIQLLQEKIHIAPFHRKIHDMHQYMIDVYIEMGHIQQAKQLLAFYDQDIKDYPMILKDEMDIYVRQQLD